MTTKIRNKQTGETLTGEIVQKQTDGYFRVAVSGTTKGINPQFHVDEWDILPPPLPTGLGAVVRKDGFVYTRVNKDTWRTPDNILNYLEVELANRDVEILSEGVQL
ncbi:MAG: hypothetical protein V4563_17040 [Pseudomonadota bacterium]